MTRSLETLLGRAGGGSGSRRRGNGANGWGSGALVALVLVILAAAIPAASASQFRPGPALAQASPVPLQTFLRSNGASPPPTALGSMAYDAADGYALMFGGQDVNQDTLGTTWIFHGGNWTNLTPSLSVAPPARYSAAMAYDAADHEVVLFGGCENPSCVPVLGDTWVFSGGRWSDLTPTLNVSPSARAGASMTYDSSGNGSILLFGGTSAGGGVAGMNDTWAFHGNRWYDVTPAAGALSPPPRSYAVLQYDPVRNQTILFGGASTLGNLDDTWGYSNGSWTELSASQKSAPSARRDAQVTYDGADGYLLLIGGYDRGTYFGDVWAFGSAGWIQISTSNSPPAVYGAEITYDAGDSVVLMFSGVGASGEYTGTWIYSGSAWQLLINPPGTLSPLVALIAGLLLVFVLLAVVMGVSYARMRVRYRSGAQGFPLSPNDPVNWYETGKSAGNRNNILAAFVVIFVVALTLPLVLVGGSSGSALVAVIFVVLFGLLFGGLLTVTNRQSRIYRIGIARSGVIFGRRAGDTRVPWSNLSPASFQLQKGSYLFQYSTMGNRLRTALVQVSTDQAKAIVRSPYAPAWPLSYDQAKPLGLQMRSSPPPGGPGVPPAPRPSRPAGGSGAAPLRSSSSSTPPAPPSPYLSAPMPGPSDGAYYPPPPPPPPAPPRIVAPPTEHLIRCGQCGQTFTPGYAFCPACGARLV